MEFINRQIATTCRKDLEVFPILTITGPRQSGKSTLLKQLLPDWQYVNLEESAKQDFARNDPQGFLSQYSNAVIIDEIQKVPSLLSEMQVNVDHERTPGRYAISGSHNLLLLESISQSLAGRTSVRHLLPFSYGELLAAKRSPVTLADTLYLGGYPLVHQTPENARIWSESYLQTYVERDVRLIKNISNLGMFRRFLRLAAGRVGQLLDYSSIANDLGVSHNTIRDWIGLLEASFIAFRLEPYFKNFSKRIIKSPKLYFYDTHLLCRLLDIRDAQEIVSHPFRGAIFENWCVTEAVKSFYNHGEILGVYFWRDRSIEVDLLISRDAQSLIAIECKSGATAHGSFIDAACKLKTIAKEVTVVPRVVYGGESTQERKLGKFYSWKKFGEKVAEDVYSI